MRWPGQRRLEDRIADLETRADSSYTDALIASITANAGGKTTAFPTATAALEACAGFVGRSFASAEVDAPDLMRPALSPGCLSMIARALIRKGEIVLLIDVDLDRGLTLLPAASHDVDGGPDPATWRYRCTVGGPERTLTYDDVPAAGVVHLAYARDPETPWRGVGPLQVAQLAGRLSAQTVAALADEAGTPHGAFLPTPAPGQDGSIAALRSDAGKAKGDLLFVQAGDWGDAGTAAAQWDTRRFGAEPPLPFVELLKIATREVMMACGVPDTLFADVGSASAREAYRIFLHSTVAPIGRLVQDELVVKLEAPVRLDWTELRAGDITGRARAFQSLVGGGMDMAAAAAASGILITEPA